MKILSLPIASFAIVFTLHAAVGAPSDEARRNWPQWRGPLATGVAPEADPPLEWSETKNVKWKIQIPGSGSASPVVWGDRVFVFTGRPGKIKAEIRVDLPRPRDITDPKIGEFATRIMAELELEKKAVQS